jgi:hypothetical protein
MLSKLAWVDIGLFILFSIRAKELWLIQTLDLRISNQVYYHSAVTVGLV